MMGIKPGLKRVVETISRWEVARMPIYKGAPVQGME